MKNLINRFNKILYIIILSSLPVYIIFSIIFPTISIQISKNCIVQIIISLCIICLLINIRKIKFSNEKVKKYMKMIEENVLIKATLILLIIIFLTNILKIVFHEEVETLNPLVKNENTIINKQ